MSIAVGDLNGDGKPDLAITIYGNSLVLSGNGNGTFGPEIPVALPRGPSQYPSIAIADLNGDGKLDLVVSPSTSNGVAVALGNGDGTFGPSTEYPAWTGGQSQIAVGDLNGDGIPDIVTAGGSILFGDGKGGFPTRSDYVSSGVGSVMLSDFDGDGKTDIIIGGGSPNALSGDSRSPSLSVLFNRGDGTFVAAPVSYVPGGMFQTFLAAADFDQDGILDLAVAAAYLPTHVTVLKGDGHGGFRPVFHYDLDGGNVQSIATADLNNDGKPDLVVAATPYLQRPQILIFLGRGDGAFAPPLSFSLPDSYAQTKYVATADLNKDGKADLVVVSSECPDRIWIYLGKGDGTFSAPVPYPGFLSVYSLAFGDFNSDGKLDMAAANQFGTITVWLGNGDGQFSIGPEISLSKNGNPNQALGPASLVAADFNRDGRIDLAASLGSGGFVILIGNGDGTFRAPSIYPGAFVNLVAADLDGDGIIDLVADRNVFLGNGDGSFKLAPNVSVPLVSVIAGDFNGDGRTDLAGELNSFGVATLLNLPCSSGPTAPP